MTLITARERILDIHAFRGLWHFHSREGTHCLKKRLGTAKSYNTGSNSGPSAHVAAAASTRLDNWPSATSSTEWKWRVLQSSRIWGSRHSRPTVLRFHPQVVTMAGYAIMAASLPASAGSGVLNAISVADLGQKLTIPPHFCN